jgi:hypothetical protein
MVDISGGAVTITMTVFGDAGFGSHMLGGAFGVANSGDVISSSMSWTAAAWSQFNTDGGDAGNGNYNTVVFGQLVLPPVFLPGAGSENGGAIGSFTVVIDAAGTANFDLTAGSPFTLEGVDATTGATQNDGGNISLGSASVTAIVPAPSAMALLGLGGLVAGRRRR